MFRKVLILGTFWMMASPLLSGVIVLKNGKKIPCAGPFEVKGRFVHYKDDKGNLFQLPLKIVDMEKSSTEVELTEEDRSIEVISQSEPKKKKKEVAFHDMVDQEMLEVSAPDQAIAVDNLTLYRKDPTRTYFWKEKYNLAEFVLWIRRGKVGKVAEMIKVGTPVGGPPYKEVGLPEPLFWTVAYGRETIAAMLLKAGANPDTHNSRGQTPLIETLKRQGEAHRNLALDLLKAGANANFRATTNETPLGVAVGIQPTEMIVALLESGANPNVRDPKGRYPIFRLIERSSLEGLAAMVKNQADLSLKNEKSQMPLVVAVAKSSIPMVKILLDGGADLYAEDAKGRSLIEVALERNDTRMAAFLLESRSLSREAAGQYLVTAVEGGHLDTAKLLLNKEASPDTRNASGDPLLVIASRGGDLEMVKLLLAAGADVYAKGREDVTAYVVASGPHADNIRALLRELYQKD